MSSFYAQEYVCAEEILKLLLRYIALRLRRAAAVIAVLSVTGIRIAVIIAVTGASVIIRTSVTGEQRTEKRKDETNNKEDSDQTQQRKPAPATCSVCVLRGI